jgi:hypothetical protein
MNVMLRTALETYSERNREKDPYGFPKKTIQTNSYKVFNAEKFQDTPPTTETTSEETNGQSSMPIWAKVLMWIAIVIAIILLIMYVSICAMVAWNENPFEPTWLRLSRTGLAIIFAPIYGPYIAVRKLAFN